MNLQVTISFTAFEEDWDIEKIVGNRSLSDPILVQELIDLLKEDPDYILENASFTFKEDRKSI